MASPRYEMKDQGHRLLITCPDGSREAFDPSTCGGSYLEDIVIGAFRQCLADLAERDAQIEALESDAARYRWLRRKVHVVGLHHLSDNDCWQFEFANLPRISEPMANVGNAADALDALIDAAITAGVKT